MIKLIKLDGQPLILNADWIQTVENTPDTLITLTNGTKLYVQDSVEKVLDEFKRYKRETVWAKEDDHDH